MTMTGAQDADVSRAPGMFFIMLYDYYINIIYKYDNSPTPSMP